MCVCFQIDHNHPAKYVSIPLCPVSTSLFLRVRCRIDSHIWSRAQVRQRLLNLHEKVEDGSASDEEKSRLLYMLRCIEWQAGGLNRRDPGFFEDDGSAESGSDGELVHVIDIDSDDKDGRETIVMDNGLEDTDAASTRAPLPMPCAFGGW